MKQERRNSNWRPDSALSEFLSRLDLRICVAGLGEEIADWPNNLEFSSDIFFRLYLPVSGEFRIITTEGELHVTPGNLYLLPALTPLKHEGIRPCTHYWLHFISKSLQYLPRFRKPLKAAVTGETSRQEFGRLLEIIRSPGSLRQQLDAKHLAERLLANFLENENMVRQFDEKLHDSFTKVLDYIDLHLSEELRVEELAALLHLSRSDFSAAFRKQFGIPPKQYIIHRRLSLAKQLLLETDERIKELALQCGYRDEFFFCRLFHRYVHFSPSAYRRSRSYS